MNFSQRPDTFETADYLRTLRRRWWIVLVLFIVGGAGAAAYIKVAPKVYAATTSVYVTANEATTNQVAGGRTSGQVNMDSEAQVVQSMAVATLAANLLHTSIPPATLSKHVAVAVPPNSQVLQITCEQPTGSSAAACSQAFARAYLQNQTTAATDALKGALSTLHGQILTLQHATAALTAKVASLPPNSASRANAQAQLTSDRAQLNSLSNQVGQLEAQMANSSPGRIITNAVVPTKPTSPRKLLVLPSGLAAGLVLGLILAFVADARDRRVHGPRDLERRTDLPVLLNLGPGRRGAESGVATPRSRTGHAFAELAHLTTAALGDGNHVVLVTSASAGSGASVAAANLAAAFTRTHAQVVLVCADLQTSAVPALFHVGADRGLAEVLSGGATVGEAMQRPADFPRLRILPPGRESSLGPGDFQHDATRRLISELRRSTPIVIIEVAPASEDGDAFAMAEFADAALVVVEVGKTTWPEAAGCTQRLDRLRTMVLGALLIPPANVGRIRLADRKLAAGSRMAPATRGPDGVPPIETAPAGPPAPGRQAGMQPQPTSWVWEETADKGARG